MDFINETEMEAGWTLGFQPDGRELLAVAVKATYSIPKNGQQPSLAETQVPLTEADEFTGEPGLSAPLYETDYAHQKPYCDVLLNCTAYAPGGRPVKSVNVAVDVATMSKSFTVFGDRVWEKKLLRVTRSQPKPFIQMPITYDCAFGGEDKDENHPERVKTYFYNLIGIGYYPLTKNKALNGKPLPNTEEIGKPAKDPKGRYSPMSLGPIARNWQPRVKFAGTYDQKWLENQSPFWPDDFSYRYFQAAPPDQQIPYPKGGEQVVLSNLSPKGIMRFHLPRIAMPILFVLHRGEDVQVSAVIDTILIEPDHDRFMITWRAALPLLRDCFEIFQVIVGKKGVYPKHNSSPCSSC
jgi:hypothetical protein